MSLRTQRDFLAHSVAKAALAYAFDSLPEGATILLRYAYVTSKIASLPVCSSSMVEWSKPLSQVGSRAP